MLEAGIAAQNQPLALGAKLILADNLKPDYR